MANKNGGKVFEALIKQAAEEQFIDYNRMKDAGFTGAPVEGRRFTPSNICDCTLFDGKALIYAEIKQRKQSMTFESLKQLNSLHPKWKPPQNVYSGVIIHFSDPDLIFFISTPRIYAMRHTLGKVSFNANDARIFGRVIAVTVPPRKKTARPVLSTIWFDCHLNKGAVLPELKPKAKKTGQVSLI